MYDCTTVEQYLLKYYILILIILRISVLLLHNILFCYGKHIFPKRVGQRKEWIELTKDSNKFHCFTVHFNSLNLTCYANQKFFKSRLVTKYSKLKLYRTVIRPIVTYALETWVLKETTIRKLLVFERKILRRIFGPTKEKHI